MARMKSIKAFDEKIHEQEERLRKMKERCDKIAGELDCLYEKKKSLEAKELLNAIARSSKLE